MLDCLARLHARGRFSLVCGSTALGISLTWCPAARAAPYDVRAPRPSWVQPMSPPAVKGSSEHRWVDYQDTLLDRQIRVSAAGTERFEHRARTVLNATGVAATSELSIDYFPDYEHAMIHSVELHRGAETRDLRPSATIREFATESDRDRRIYDGTHRIEIILPDIRPGDEIEYSFTIVGSNPALGDHFNTAIALGSLAGLDRGYVSLLWPASRPLQQKIHGSNLSLARSDEGSMVRFWWRSDAIPSVTMEDEVPDWYTPVPFAEFTDFGSWSDVVAWALPLYDAPTDLPHDLAARVAEIAHDPSPTARLIEATKLVQNEVRYVGIELGKGALAPRNPADVWSRRYGDCKDKALLLVAVLEKLGIDAAPALVDSLSGQKLDTHLPTVGAFDHVIARAVADGVPRWIDATMSHIDGDIEAFEAPDYGYALVIDEGTKELTRMPSPTLEEPTTDVVETYSISSESEVRLRVSTRYRGGDATWLRRRLESESPRQIGRKYLNYYARDYPGIEQLRDVVVTRQPRGEVTLEEEYRIDNFFEDGKSLVRAWSIGEALDRPEVVKRSMPFALSYPLFIRHTVVVDWTPDASFDTDPIEIDSKTLLFRRHATSSASRVETVYELRTRSDHVGAADVAEYLDVIRRISDEIHYELNTADNEPPRVTSKSTAAFWIACACAPLGGGALLYAWRGRRRRKWLRKSKELPGESAANAIPVGRSEDIARKLEALRCKCGRKGLRRTAAEVRTVRYDGRELLATETACGACDTIATRYFVATS